MENELKQQLFSSHRDEVFERISGYRDNGTHADEALRFFKVLFLVSMVFTVGYGIALHYNLTLPYLGQKGAVVFAIFFTAFIEIGKFMLGRWTIRNIFFGIFKQGIPSAFITLCGLAITIGAFWWSYYNSTQGVAYITGYMAETHVERPKVDIAATTANVDARQQEVQKLAKRGLSIQWKGNTTVKGQRIAERAAAATLEQERQRTILIEQAAREQERLDTHRNTFIDNVASLLAMLGGKMEWFQMIILLGMIGAEKTLYDRAKQKGRFNDLQADAPGKGFRAQHVPHTENGTPEGPAFRRSSMWENRAGGSPIGFNVDPDTGNVKTSTINGLPHQKPDVYHNVIRPTTPTSYMSADHTLKQILTRIRADAANLRNGNGLPRTVCGRMHVAINEAAQAMTNSDFVPTAKVATDFYVYMSNTAFPMLTECKRPYEWEIQFLEDLHRFVDADELFEA